MLCLCNQAVLLLHVMVLCGCVQVSAVGAGLLLGSALCIILPEGFEAALQVRHM
jgi:hypothetical protein